MLLLTSPHGIRVSYRKSGSGPPLVLVHGGFSDHHTNWEFVEPLLREHFTLYAMARRNRGLTKATQGHSLLDEAHDVVALMRHVGEPVFLLGHSYGAQCALGAARLAPECVRTLVLYEPPRPSAFSPAFATLESLRASELWPPIVMDAPASFGDIRALCSHAFDAAEYRGLLVPVGLQVGSESRHELYVTDELAAALPRAHLTILHGQAHEGMTTAPQMYAETVTTFLLGAPQL